MGLLLCFLFVFVIQNLMVTVTHYTVASDKIGKAFDGFIILQISDLHSINSENMITYLAGKIEKEEPDIIVITGDLIDSGYYHDRDMELMEEKLSMEENEDGIPDELTIQFLKIIVEIAPVFYVYGNHEMILLDDVENNPFKKAVEESGVRILNNNRLTVRKGEDFFYLLGVQDPATVYKDKVFARIGNSEETMRSMLEHITQDMEGKTFQESRTLQEGAFKLLLSHRPELFALYQEYGMDLSLTGHSHGGALRLPFIGGVYASSQGFFPEYDSGLYEEGGSRMIVSRGIGNSKIPFRLFNTPELVCVTLYSE